MKNKKDINGITLISLVITIVIMLILAGVSINLIIGNNGLINKTKDAKNTSEEAKKEENKSLEDAEKVIDDLNNSNNQLAKESDNAFILNGGTYINTNVAEADIVANNEYTIKAKVYINRSIQQSIVCMDILGNHIGTGQILWQFDAKTSNLYFVRSSVGFDFTPYYDKWTSLVTTYKDGVEKVYVNGELKAQGELTVTPYSNLLIGSAYLSQDRFLRGGIASVEVYNKAMDESQINYVPDSSNVLLSLDFKDMDSINKYGSLVGSNYQIINLKEKSFRYAFKFNHYAYLNTDLAESTIVENNKFTIATRVKINRAEQATVACCMDILGNHVSLGNIIWQFDGAKTFLYFSDKSVGLDYTPYYDKWIDMVGVYDNGTEYIYFNGELVAQGAVTITPYSNLLIGTGYLNENRTMYGYMDSVKVWNDSLTQNEVRQLDLRGTSTTIKQDNLLKEINFNNYDDLVSNGLTNASESNYILEVENIN